jgi:hypothetical protein
MIEKPFELKFKDSYVDLLDEVVFALLKEKKAQHLQTQGYVIDD